jgi:hypothetical protein
MQNQPTKLDLSEEDDDDDASNSSSAQYNKRVLNSANASYSTRLKCWLHLARLFANACKKSTPLLLDQTASLLPVIICGFSKGCVILNELCNELEFVNKSAVLVHEENEEAREVLAFLGTCRHLIWLDGGHSGQSNGWITRVEIIRLMRAFHLHCYVHVTPYQIKSRKTWAVEEYRKFVQLLESEELTFVSKYYFAERDEDFDINVHFELLKCFDTRLI